MNGTKLNRKNREDYSEFNYGVAIRFRRSSQQTSRHQGKIQTNLNILIGRYNRTTH